MRLRGLPRGKLKANGARHVGSMRFRIYKKTRCKHRHMPQAPWPGRKSSPCAPRNWHQHLMHGGLVPNASPALSDSGSSFNTSGKTPTVRRLDLSGTEKRQPQAPLQDGRRLYHAWCLLCRLWLSFKAAAPSLGPCLALWGRQPPELGDLGSGVSDCGSPQRIMYLLAPAVYPA